MTSVLIIEEVVVFSHQYAFLSPFDSVSLQVFQPQVKVWLQCPAKDCVLCCCSFLCHVFLMIISKQCSQSIQCSQFHSEVDVRHCSVKTRQAVKSPPPAVSTYDWRAGCHQIFMTDLFYWWWNVSPSLKENTLEPRLEQVSFRNEQNLSSHAFEETFACWWKALCGNMIPLSFS